MTPGAMPVIDGGRPPYLINKLDQLGLTDGLRLCLDPGDALSFDGTSQTWNDRSGSGLAFLRGASTSVSSDDPAFNGEAGRGSGDEYFSFDGGDILRLSGANPAWVNNLHKDGALFTLIEWVWPVAGTTNRLFCTGTPQSTNVGVLTFLASGGNANYAVCRATSGSFAIQSSLALTHPWTGARWNMVSYAIGENDGATGSWVGNNNAAGDYAFNTFNANLSSPSSANASGIAEIGSSGNGDVPMPSGSRVGMFALWEGVKLAQTDIQRIFDATREIYGV